MKEITDNSTPPMPRFNAWRLIGMIVFGGFVLALPFVGLFFWQLANSNVNIAESYFLSEDEQEEKLVATLNRITALEKDTARLGRQIRLLQRQAPKTISVSNTKHNVSLVPSYARKQSEFKSFGAWAVEGMRYYRSELNKVYKSLGVEHQVK